MPTGKIRNSLVFEALRKFSLLLGYSSVIYRYQPEISVWLKTANRRFIIRLEVHVSCQYMKYAIISYAKWISGTMIGIFSV
jgi:hypothetical protein